MKKLNNVLYVTTFDTYLSLDGENIVIKKENAVLKRIPLHNLEGIITFGYSGASPALMGACAKHNIALSFFDRHGHFIARVCGKQYGNVLLRKKQYHISEQEVLSLKIAKNMMLGKFYNSKWVLERTIRDYHMRIDTTKLKSVTNQISTAMKQIDDVDNFMQLLGVEGKVAESYFSVFDDMILQQKKEIYFRGRNKRPPKDIVNALLSFVYTLLAHDCAAALESVGLDPYVGFYHRDRPGRISLALDLMEELRSVLADRFVISLINKKVVNADGFTTKENGAVLMDDDTRRKLLSAWQLKKNDTIEHPFLKEKIEWGLVPFVQAQLLSRYLREDLDEYPPFFWK